MGVPATTATRLGVAILAGAPTAVALARGGVDFTVVAVASGCLLAAAALVLPSTAPPPLASAGLALAIGVSVLQLVPLPPVLHGLSPLARDVFETSLAPVGLYPAWRPLSLDTGGTARGIVHALACLGAFTSAAAFSRTRRRKRWLTAAVAASSIAVVLVVLGGALAGVASLVEPRFPFVNPNHLSGLLSLGALVCLGLAMDRSGQARYAWLLGFVAVAATVFLSLSRGGMAGLAAGLAVLGALQLRHPGSARRLATIAATTGLVLVAAAYVALAPIARELGAGERVLGKTELWGPALRVAAGAPLTGIGRGAFASVFPAFKDDRAPVTYTHVENEWLQAFVDLGFPAGLVLLASVAGTWLAAFLREGQRRLDTGLLAGTAALGVHEFFDFSLEALGVAIPFFVALGLLARPSRRLPWSMLAGRWAAPVGLGFAAIAVAVSVYAAEAVAPLTGPVDDLAHTRAAAARALAVAPSDHLPHLRTGAAAVAEGRVGEAMSALLRAMRLNPTDAQIHRFVARCLSASGRHELARFEYRLAILQGDPSVIDEAASVYPDPDQLVGMVPDEPDELLRAATRLAVARPAFAERALRKAWTDHGELRALEPLAHLLILRGAHDEALSIARELTARGGPPAEAALLEARALAGLGRRDESREALERGAQVSPGDWRFLVGIAEGHLAQRRFSRARAVAGEIAPRTSREAAAKYLLFARILAAQERLPEAIEQANAASAAAPQDPEVLEQLASFEERAGRLADAVASLERARTVSAAARPDLSDRISRLRAALVDGASSPVAPATEVP